MSTFLSTFDQGANLIGADSKRNQCWKFIEPSNRYILSVNS